MSLSKAHGVVERLAWNELIFLGSWPLAMVGLFWVSGPSIGTAIIQKVKLKRFQTVLTLSQNYDYRL